MKEGKQPQANRRPQPWGAKAPGLLKAGKREQDTRPTQTILETKSWAPGYLSPQPQFPSLAVCALLRTGERVPRRGPKYEPSYLMECITFWGPRSPIFQLFLILPLPPLTIS